MRKRRIDSEPIKMRYALDYQANKIELITANHARVSGGRVKKGQILFRLALGGRQFFGDLRQSITEQLGVRRVKLKRRGDTIELTLSRRELERVLYLELIDALPRSGLTALLGLDALSRPLALDLFGVTHLLVLGSDPKVRSDFIDKLLLSMTMRYRQADLQVVSLNLNRKLGNLPHLIWTEADANKILRRLANLLYKRQQCQGKRPAVVVVLDSMDQLTPSDWDLLRPLLRAHRWGFHVIAASQYHQTRQHFPTSVHIETTDTYFLVAGPKQINFQPVAVSDQQRVQILGVLKRRRNYPIHWQSAFAAGHKRYRL